MVINGVAIQATEERGENARLSSFVGAMALGDLVKSTLGPKGMNKILRGCTILADVFELIVPQNPLLTVTSPSPTMVLPSSNRSILTIPPPKSLSTSPKFKMMKSETVPPLSVSLLPNSYVKRKSSSLFKKFTLKQSLKATELPVGRPSERSRRLL